jgi:hypothetical protein|tara:strand:- start:15410 stop:16687 length:1278 start_codon:yes stop_codon:yes gene_type:complete
VTGFLLYKKSGVQPRVFVYLKFIFLESIPLMKNLLSAPAKMALSDVENVHYQKSLTHIAELDLNLMAVKVTDYPEDFLGWCIALLEICKQGINRDLLNDDQFKPLEKLTTLLESAASTSQLKMASKAPWPVFVSFIEQQTTLHALEERLTLLDYVRGLEKTDLSAMSDLDRLVIAGKHTNKHIHTVYNFDIEWFASTKGAKIFQTLFTEQPSAFDHALSFIPLTGDVTPAQYKKFVVAYKEIFSTHTKDKANGEKAPLAPASRLLAMRRPDQFMAITNTKIAVLCQGLGIQKFNNYDFESYWQDLIGTVRTFAWWHQSEPSEPRERKLWQARVILMDLFLFADEDFAATSNYLRIRDKKLSSSVSSYKSTRTVRVKLTNEQVVDQALAEEGIPEYIIRQRDTILSEVKKGKNVEHVIKLLRAIFG